MAATVYGAAKLCTVKIASKSPCEQKPYLAQSKYSVNTAKESVIFLPASGSLVSQCVWEHRVESSFEAIPYFQPLKRFFLLPDLSRGNVFQR